MLTGRVIHQQHTLTGCASTPGHEPDFKSDTIAGSGGFRDKDIAAREPVDVALIHLALRQHGFSPIDVVCEQVGGEHLVPMLLESLADRTARQNASAFPANSAC